MKTSQCAGKCACKCAGKKGGSGVVLTIFAFTIGYVVGKFASNSPLIKISLDIDTSKGNEDNE